MCVCVCVSLSVMSDSLQLFVTPPWTVHGILQARILKWVAILFARGSSRPKNRTRVSCIAGRFCTIWVTREATLWKWHVIGYQNSSNWRWQDFPSGPVVKNPPANAGDTGPVPHLGRWHTPPGNWAPEPQLLKRVPQSPCSAPEKHHSEKPVHFSWRGASARLSQRKPVHSDQDPVRPINK